MNRKKAGKKGGQFNFLTVGGAEAASLCYSSFGSYRMCHSWRLGRASCFGVSLCVCREVSCCFLLLKKCSGWVLVALHRSECVWVSAGRVCFHALLRSECVYVCVCIFGGFLPRQQRWFFFGASVNAHKWVVLCLR